jgi:hypothetical protein
VTIIAEVFAMRRTDGRCHDTGLIKPTRPCPHDFRETYICMGWDGITDHYNTNWRCIRRWIIECGGEALKRDRAAYVKAHGAKSLHGKASRRRYVMGQTLKGGVK